VSRKVFGSSADGDRRFKDLETNVSPFPCRFEIDASGGERVDEFSSGCFESAGSDEYRSGNFVRFKEFNCLRKNQHADKIKGKILREQKTFPGICEPGMSCMSNIPQYHRQVFQCIPFFELLLLVNS
jgi:hypothetical protein